MFGGGASTCVLMSHSVLGGLTSECKSLWGGPERVRRIAVNIKGECTV